MYAQKLCMPSARGCTRAWGFELVRGYHLKDAGKKNMQLPSRVACMDACIQEREFPCRSAWWNPVKTECVMSDLDRYGLGVSSRFEAAENTDYMESQCVQEPNRMCEFRKIENRLLKTVDALYEGVATLDECRQLCLEAPFRCHTFDFEGVCRLSHHATATVTQVQEPYLSMNGSLSYERGACYNVSLDCQANHMLATLHTNKVFNGKVYARQRPNSCVVDITESMTFDMKLEYADPGCGVKQEEAGRFAVDLVLQHHDQIMTSSDLGFALRCSFHLENRSVAHGIELQVNGQIQSMASESAVVPSPNVTMRITDREGGDINTAQVGDPLSLRFEIVDSYSPYEIFVRELIAMDGADGAEIVLIDNRGCPTDPSIMGPVGQISSNGKLLQAYFEAFKFPTSDVVQFQALVTPCLPSCSPVDCSLPADPSTTGVFHAKSYGRRRRRSWGSTGNSTHEAENVLVINSIRIADRFKFDENGERIPMDGSEDVSSNFGQRDIMTSRSVSGQCLNIFGFLVCCFVLVIVQVAIIFAWMYLWRRKRTMSKEEAAVASMGAMSATPAHYFFAASHQQQAPVHHSQFSRKFLHQVSGEVPSLPRLS
ncbi:EGF-like domain-containing protein 2, partial [Orchesella cincta]